MTDIFEFWAGLSAGETRHPNDTKVLDRQGHQFDLRCLPGPWMGPLKTAKVVLLYLSPGLSDMDVDFSQSDQGQKWISESREGTKALPSYDDHGPAYTWWTSRTKIFGDARDIASKIAFANIGPYHSSKLLDFPMLASLPSARAMLSWAQDTLFEEAIRGERTVVCMRSPSYWGLRSGWSSGQLFSPPTTRGGHMIHGRTREVIVKAIKSRLRGL